MGRGGTLTRSTLPYGSRHPAELVAAKFLLVLLSVTFQLLLTLRENFIGYIEGSLGRVGALGYVLNH
jgi:hypothetical protein